MDLTPYKDTLEPVFELIANDVSSVLDTLSLSQTASILDVGTGKGYFAIVLALHGFDVLTGEPSTDQSHYTNHDWRGNAQKVGVENKIHFQAFAADSMPFADQSYDVVCFGGVLHHIDEAKRQQTLAETYRVLKPGGVVVFFEPNDNALVRIRENDPTHPAAANPDDYVQGLPLTQSQLAGQMMLAYIYRKTA